MKSPTLEACSLLPRRLETFAKFTLSVWEQDRVIVESQQPGEVPEYLGAEIHIHGPDGPSLVYRRMLNEMRSVISVIRPTVASAFAPQADISEDRQSVSF